MVDAMILGLSFTKKEFQAAQGSKSRPGRPSIEQTKDTNE